MSPILSRQYASQLLFEVSRSKVYQRIVITCALLAMLAIFSLDVSFFVYLILFIALSLFVFFAIRNNCQRTLQWQPDGQWLIEWDENKCAATLQSGSVVTPFFAALNFKLENKSSLNIILFKDNMDKDKFRQLRVRMKVEGITSRVEVATLTDN